jgi:hypothetical protein
MRRGIVFLLILAALVFFAWQVVLKPKPKPVSKTTAVKKGKTENVDTSGTVKKRGKKVGKLKKLSKEERKAENERLRAEKKRQKVELRRRKREERLAKASARKKKSTKGTRSKKGLSANVLQAIIWFDVGPSYAMIDGRKYEVGDVISGRKIIAIKQDQIIVDYRGNQTVVRMGESVLPQNYYGTERRRR